MNWKHCFSSFILLCCLTTQNSANNLESQFTIHSVPTTEKIVALTFDDGPKLKTTGKLLHILNKKKIKASFFLTANNIKKHPELAQSIHEDHHSIGNHGFNHERVSHKSTKEIIQLIANSQLTFYEHLKMIPMYYRPPYGEYRKSQTKLLQTHFKHLILWNIDPKDWSKHQTKKKIIKHIMKNLKPGSIIVLHENKKTIELLPSLIHKIQKNGYTCVSIDKLLNYK